MNPIKLRFYTERFEKERKYFRLQEEFVAIGRAKPLTGKFYAKHQVIPVSEVRQEYVDLIVKRQNLSPKDIYTFRPPTVNMEYGWFAEPFIPRTDDSRLRFPIEQSDFIGNELRIRHLQKGLPVEKFTGVPFVV
ncbi:PREDICTED: uncharacterized protein LOC108579402 [Habropoda laboriosa]|uniref:uncharacterized protein LOC108579402 n=1 Tax=Habropoda laboriosa TaxID=597456 RepID=UPI00083E36A1|nr:PREDICTED: uncharacterized protein LOC108579402 [Habropoda laboriosa]